MGGLADELRRTIAHHGPITVAAYMETVLAHPRLGVYTGRDPFGAGGDFTTAPEISQMFGELIGLWSAVVWQAMGRPDPVALVELGPGRGTLIADALRAAHGVAPFRAAVRLHLVETSLTLSRLNRPDLRARLVNRIARSMSSRGLSCSLTKAALTPTVKATNIPDSGNLIRVAAKVPPTTMRNPGRLRNIHRSDPVSMARVTTMTPMISPSTVITSNSSLRRR